MNAVDRFASVVISTPADCPPPSLSIRSYQKTYRELAKKHPSFRERSETTELIVEISLQPWNSFRPDGVIMFSDILTPLPAIGINFDIDDNKGPIIDTPIRGMDQVKQLHSMDYSKVDFVGRCDPDPALFCDRGGVRVTPGLRNAWVWPPKGCLQQRGCVCNKG